MSLPPLLSLPISHSDLQAKIIVPALMYLPAKLRGDPARVEIGAIAGQESKLNTRRQMGNGPARGLWQFEMSGVHGVNTHSATTDFARGVCRAFEIPFSDEAVYAALERCDELAACYARLNLWWYSKPLPAIGQQDAAYDYYVGIWKPGKPDETRWPAQYQAAVAAVRG